MNKNVEVKVQFNDGSIVTNIVAVNKNKYAGLQSKACNRKKALAFNVLTNKMTADDARADWEKSVVAPWTAEVADKVKDAYPETVRDLITSIRPTAQLLDLVLTEKSAEVEMPDAE